MVILRDDEVLPILFPPLTCNLLSGLHTQLVAVVCAVEQPHPLISSIDHTSFQYPLDHRPAIPYQQPFTFCYVSRGFRAQAMRNFSVMLAVGFRVQVMRHGFRAQRPGQGTVPLQRFSHLAKQ